MKSNRLIFLGIVLILVCLLASCGGDTVINGNTPSAYPKIELSSQNSMATEYSVGDTIDYTGLVILYKATANSAGTQISYASYPNRFTFSAVDMTTKGTKTLTVTCEECSLNITITVNSTPLGTPANIGVNDFLISWDSSGDDVKNYSVEITYLNVSLSFTAVENSLIFPYEYTEQGRYIIRVKANIKDGIDKSDSLWSENFNYDFYPVGLDDLSVMFEVIADNAGDYIAITGARTNRTSIKIPATIRNLPVRKINAHAFVDGSFSTIEFADDCGLLQIGEFAFENCTDLTSISPKFPDSLVTLGNSAFSGCTALTAADFGPNLISLPDFAFLNCNALESLTLPSALETIGASTFSGCYSLTEEITLPASVTSIGDSAFLNTMFDQIYLPSGLNTLGASAFKDCKRLSSIVIPSALRTLNTQAFMGDIGLIRVSFSGEGLISIGSKAFSGCTNLKSIEFPSSLTSIGAEAFLNDTSLDYIYLSYNVTSVNALSFSGSAVKEISVPQSIYYSFKDLPTVETANIRAVGENTTLMKELFIDNAYLKEIILDEKFTQVDTEGDTSPFTRCSALSKLSIPFNIYSDSLVSDCSDLKYLTLLCDENAADKDADTLDINLTLDKITFDRDLLSVSTTALSDANIKIVEIPVELILNGSTNVLGSLSGISELILISGNRETNITSLISSMLSPFSAYLTLLDINSSTLTDAAALKEALLDFDGVETLGIPFNLFDSDIKAKFSAVTNLAFYAATAGENRTVLPGSLIGGMDLSNLTLSPFITAFADGAVNILADDFDSLTMQAGIQNMPSAFPSTLKTLNLTKGYDGETVFASLPSGFLNGVQNEIQTVNFSDEIEEINGPSFIDSSYISNFNVFETNPYFMKIGQILYSYDGTKLVLAPRATNLGVYSTANDRYELTVDESVLTIGLNIIPLKTIGAGAFAGSKLQCVTVPLNISEIQNGAFMNCQSLESVTLPSTEFYAVYSLKIGDSAFENCTSLVSIDFPLTVKSLGKASFKGCTSLKEASASKTVLSGSMMNFDVTEIPEEMFMNCTSLAFESSNLINVTNIWASDLGTITSNGIQLLNRFRLTKIGKNAFYGCTSLNLVRYPLGDITEIGEGAFENCTSLTYFSLPRALETIGDRAFRNTKIQTNESLTTSAELNLTNTAGADNLKTIGNYAFQNVTTLYHLVYPISLQTIGEGAFTGCSSLDYVSNNGTETSLVTIGINAFKDCTSLKSFVFCTSITEISEGAFYNCADFIGNSDPTKGLEIPSSVQTIGNSAFYGCISLTKATIRYNTLISTTGITLIDENAFYGCEKLVSLYIGNPVAPTAFANSFSGCNTVSDVDVSNSGDGIIYVYVSDIEEYNNKWGTVVPNFSAQYCADF